MPAIAKISTSRIHGLIGSRPIYANNEETDGNHKKEAPRFTRVTRDANSVSVVISDNPIPQPQVEVSMSLFGDEWSLPEIMPAQKHTRGNYTKKVDDEEIEAAQFRYVAVQNRLRAWDSEEVEWLHEILLHETNREMREAINDSDIASITGKLTWYEDASWRPFSFPVCCAIVGANPAEVLQGIHQGLKELLPTLHFDQGSPDLESCVSNSGAPFLTGANQNLIMAVYDRLDVQPEHAHIGLAVD